MTTVVTPAPAHAYNGQRTQAIRPLADFKRGLPVLILAKGVVTRVSANYGAKVHPSIGLQNDDLCDPSDLEILGESRDDHVTVRISVDLDDIITAEGMDPFNDLALGQLGDDLGQDLQYQPAGVDGEHNVLIDVTFLPHDRRDELGDKDDSDDEQHDETPDGA